MNRSRAVVAPLLVCLAAAACPGESPVPTADVEFGTVKGLLACDDATVAAHPDHRCFTWRGVAGVSMGGGTSSRVGFTNPQLWDLVGVMGTPFADNEFFWGMIEQNHMGGFCDKATLDDLVARGVDLNDPENPEIFCGVHDVYPLAGDDQVAPGLHPAIEDSRCSLFRSDFNHWYRGPDTGRGGKFSRNGLIEIVHDLTAAFGNPLMYSEESAYFPPGVPSSWYVTPNGTTDKAALCAAPVVIEGLYNAEYNPDGSLPVVTFCDGGSGDEANWDPADPAARSVPVEFAVAVDFNGNGVRDYAEPIVINNKERFRDFGADGLASVDEDGYDAATNRDPAGDDYDALTNPTGTEGNFRRDDVEAFDDFGIDGVPGTSDFGEGNGVYDLSPNLERLFARSPSSYFRALSDDQVKRLDVWLDAGIRDFLNTAQITNALFAALRDRVPSARAFNDFEDLPGIEDEYVYSEADYSRAAMGQVSYLRYGDPDICPSSDDTLGDGNHVGPDVVFRIFTLFSFLSERMPKQGRDSAIGGALEDLESPTRSIVDFGFMTSYDSAALGREVRYGISLPPDYYLPEAQNQSYPVLYFFHGQGMDPDGLVALGYAMFGPMREVSQRPDRAAEFQTDLQRAILVWVDGNCHGDECYTGNFYADFEGLPRDDRRFESAFYELVADVEANYRTKKPELIPLADLE